MVGGAGFIGSWLAQLLVEEGAKVVAIDPITTASEIPEEMFTNVKKFRDEKMTGAVTFVRPFEEDGIEVVKDVKPDVVIQLAAKPLENPNNKILTESQVFGDTRLTYDVIQAANLVKAKKFIYLSSIFAHGDFEGYSVTEDMALNPTTPYGISKAVGEFYVKHFCKMPWNIVRTTSVYGFGDSNMRATQMFLNRAWKKQGFWVNALSWPDFLYIKDLVRGITDVITTEHTNEVFNISGGNMSPLEDFAEIVADRMNTDYEVKHLDDRPRRGSLVNDKARAMLGWKPFYDLHMGIDDYIDDSMKYKHG